MNPATPALTPATPISTVRVTWLDTSAASDTGTNRRNRRPASVSSRRRTGPGARRQARLLILLGIAAMRVLRCGNGVIEAAAPRIRRRRWDINAGTETQYGTRIRGQA